MFRKIVLEINDRVSDERVNVLMNELSTHFEFDNINLEVGQ